MSSNDGTREFGNADLSRSLAECTGHAESGDANPPVSSSGEEVPQLTNYHGRNSAAGPIPVNGGVQESSSPRYHVSSSLSRRGPLWPQTFEQQMEIYGRSPSGRLNRQDSLRERLLESSSLKESAEDRSPQSPIYEGDKKSFGTDEAVIAKEYELKDLIVEEKSSFLQACLNGTNVLAGVGILSTPYALSQGGWLSLGFLLLFAVICLYTGILLRKCLDTHPSVVTYPDIGQAAFGRKGRLLVSVMLYFELYCVTVEFLIMEGDNLANIFPFADFTVGGFVVTAHQFYVVLSALCFMPTVWLRDLSLLSYISAGGVIACWAIVSVIGYVGVFEGVGFSHTGTLINFSGLPVAVGISAFCFCGHAVFPNIYRSMKNRDQFTKVLIVCFTFVTILYGGIAVLGYTMFGEDLESQVTLNLPRSLISSRVAIWIILVNPFAKFALTITPLAVALEEFLPWNPTSKEFLLGSMCIRSLLVFSTVIVALAIPFFGLMMAFIGSCLSITVAVILPCLCYLRIYGRGVSFAEVSVLITVVFVGVITGFVGTYSAIRGMIGNDGR
ncbi:hypothetical protein R1flu_004596 [Riccia fluitans]|uniref:Amino acid transporter transmembrane domain-containing protein n=1 Tax=Riccia fluitans TaxID=41844 RepID=A0ABD1YTT9_9MARC